MVYVEWLRVRNALRILGIILVALIVLGGIARLSLAGFESNFMSTTTVPAPMIVRNGNTTTVLEPNNGVRIVLHTRGNSITWQKAAPLTHADLRELRCVARTHHAA